MKKILIAIAALAAVTCVAAPHHVPAGHRAPVVHRGPPPRPAPIPHHHHHSVWGRGGSHFWPGFTGGLVGSLLAPAVVPPPPPRPIVYVNQVWVPPVYETRPIYDTYGRIIRYEQVVVVPGYWR